ncbi:MAG: hypothetical protein IJA86_00935 [Clostridia bacterium]|nr:hypothetical protein [Clostridia bacterium]
MRTKKILFGYLIAAIVAGLGFAVWRTVLMILYYDPYRKEYMAQAKPSMQAFGYIMFFVLLLLATSICFFIKFHRFSGRHEFSVFTAADHQSSTFTSALLGFIFLAVGVFLSFSLSAMLSPTKYIIYKYMQLISFILLFFSSAYFIIHAANDTRFSKIKPILAFAPPLFGLSFLLASYVNPLYLYKDFNHTLCNVSLCALTCFFLFEAKASITKKAAAPYFVFSLLALVTSMANILPNFLLLAYWELSSELHFIFEAVEIGAILYIISVAFHLVSSVHYCEPVLPEEKTEYITEETEVSKEKP